MEWSELFDHTHRPARDEINKFVGNPLWNELNTFLQQTYSVKPMLAYSGCSMQKGWNVKYRKGGKSLCTLYPMQGYYIVLVVVGAKELAEADLLISFCSEYTQNLYHKTKSATGGKWLMLNVTNADILRDIKDLIALRVKP